MKITVHKKPIDYFNKHRDDVKLNQTEGVWGIFEELSLEMGDVLLDRGCRSMRELSLLVREFNLKWNAIAQNFKNMTKGGGRGIMKRDAFEQIWAPKLTIEMLNPDRLLAGENPFRPEKTPE